MPARGSWPAPIGFLIAHLSLRRCLSVREMQRVAECCRVLQRVAESCRELQRVAESCRELQRVTEGYRVM